MKDYTPNRVAIKECCRCHERLPGTREFFYADKRATDGLYGHCKKCHNEYGRSRYEGERREKTLENQRRYRKEFPERRKATLERYYQNNKESILERQRVYENSEKGIATKSNWLENNRDKRRKIANRYVEKNRDRLNQETREKRKNNPGAFSETSKRSRVKRRVARNIEWQRREAIKANLPSDFTTDDWNFALNYFNGRCAACGRPPAFFHRLDMDHWIPLSNPDCPGTVPTNIIPLCGGVGGCNQQKHASDPHEWLIKKFGKKSAGAISNRIHKYFSLVRKTD